MCAILLEIKMEPLQAACQAVKLHRMTAATGEDPVEIVGKYLDYFVRVREVVPIETLVNKAVAQIEKCDLGDGEKTSADSAFAQICGGAEGTNCGQHHRGGAEALASGPGLRQKDQIRSLADPAQLHRERLQRSWRHQEECLRTNDGTGFRGALEDTWTRFCLTASGPNCSANANIWPTSCTSRCSPTFR